MAISTQKFDGKIEYVTTPKLADVAFLKTRLTNSSGAPILGGKVNVFRDGDFIGDSHVNFIAPGADFDFYLGTDDNVKVTRKTLVDGRRRMGFSRSARGLRANTKRRWRTSKISGEGDRAGSIASGQDASITVRDVKFSETPTQEKDTGKLTWTFDLAPKQKKQITEEFTVDWPPTRREFLNQRVDLSGEGEVFLCKAALAVGRERKADGIPADVDIRVVVGDLGDDGHAVYVVHRVGEVSEDTLAGDGGTVARPGGHGGEFVGDFHLGKQAGHGGNPTKIAFPVARAACRLRFPLSNQSSWAKFTTTSLRPSDALPSSN